MKAVAFIWLAAIAGLVSRWAYHFSEWLGECLTITGGIAAIVSLYYGLRYGYGRRRTSR